MQSNRESGHKKNEDTSEFIDALKKGALLGAAALVIALPAMHYWKQARAPQQPAVVQQPAPVQPPVAQQPAPPPPLAQAPQPEPEPARRLADFNGESASEEVKLVANWSTWTQDHKKHAFVILDKKNAHLYVFGTDAKLMGSTPVLLGKAKGDHTVPGIGNKPLSLVKEDEKTTPAGRFMAEPGRNTAGEDIIWVDYDAAVSMHRIRKVAEKERRYERLASPTKADNRISFGCINIPVAFYEGVLDPTVKKTGAVVYVLPEVWSLEKAIGAYDVTKGTQVAQRT